jgi:hypothetical protein
MREQFDGISFLQTARTYDVCVETQSSAKPTDDVAEHAGILFAGVRVVGRHDATPAEVNECDVRARQSQCRARPRALGSLVDSSDEDVRAQPSDIATEHRHGAVRAHEQRQDVEPLRPVKSLQPRARCDGGLDTRGYFA